MGAIRTEATSFAIDLFSLYFHCTFVPQNIIFMWYFLIGIIYLLVNTLIRKIEVDDWTLPFVWIFLWPFCFAALLFDGFGWVKKIVKKI